ncbi:MAG: hypothetical protein H0T13_08605 [Actinobacteria bacterium]|nr:hypothetical protein [Actinomycetota bacterium]
MPFWRREEPLHERLRREGGLAGGETPPALDSSPNWGEVGIHGVHRQRVWDAVTVVEAPELQGDEARFVAVEDGTLIAETDDLDVGALADALEGTLQTPYRAEAVRRGDGLWAVAGRRIVVASVEEEVSGDHVTVTMRSGERTVEVDGKRSFGGIPSLERLIEDNAVVIAQRLDDTLWEVEVAAL